MDRAINRTYEEYTPVVEWSHSADASFVKIIVPGFKREEIRVLVDNHGHLRTRGERPVEGGRWSRFQKDLQLPSDCNVDGIRAKFENEALTITLPKKHPSPAPATPVMPSVMPAPATPKPEPRRPYAAPSQKPPAALPEPARPSATAHPPVVPSQKPFPDRRPSLPRKPADIPAPARPAPPLPAAPAPESETLNKHNGAAATAKPELPAFPKPTGEWVKEEAMARKSHETAAEEEKQRMEREARGKMEEDRKVAEGRKTDKETERMMDMARRRMPTPANRGLLVNVAVAALVLVGITVYVWRNLSAAAGGAGGDAGTGSYGDEM